MGNDIGANSSKYLIKFIFIVYSDNQAYLKNINVFKLIKIDLKEQIWLLVTVYLQWC